MVVVSLHSGIFLRLREDLLISDVNKRDKFLVGIEQLERGIIEQLASDVAVTSEEYQTVLLELACLDSLAESF